MELNNIHYQQIADCFPRQRGNVSLDNLSVLNAFLYVAENGCKWRKLPSNFGNWHTVYLYCVFMPFGYEVRGIREYSVGLMLVFLIEFLINFNKNR